MLTPALGRTGAVTGAVLFYLFHNGIGAAASFPGGWLADRLGKEKVLAGAYATFAVACLVGILGSGPPGVVLMAVPVGISAPLVVATEQSLTGALVPERVSGTAFGVLGAVNGVGDLVSSVVAGLLWSSVGAGAGLGYGALLGVAGAVLLLLLVRRPQLVAAGQVLGE
jgi:MFS family permease